MIYSKIKELEALGFSQRNIAKQLGVSRNTVAKYRDKDVETFTTWLASTKHRKQKFDEHKERILDWLRTYPDLTTAQIQDWLEERGFENIVESTLRRYVKNLREEYQLPKKVHQRQYEAIPDPPMGEQAQIDFGQIWVMTENKQRIKLYVVAFVLSHSRYKYMEWWDHPYRTEEVIQAHEHAFQYFSGKPKTIVYDQDRTLFIDENYGDIIFTPQFETYRQTQRFKVHACRGSDPESKGRIENVIGFIKNNFARNRIYSDLDSWNHQALAWLTRTGNGKMHNSTKQIPEQVFKEEQRYLLPAFPLRHKKTSPESVANLEVRRINKDNTIKYLANRYSVPRDTYNQLSYVSVKIENEQLFIFNPKTGEHLATHSVCLETGRLIKNRNHERDRTHSIKKLIERVSNHFTEKDVAKSYLEMIHQRYPRYTRDQLELIDTLCQSSTQLLVDRTLAQCLHKHIFSATEFRDILKRITKQAQLSPLSEEISIPIISRQTKEKLLHIEPEIRNLADYAELLGGER
jgi:transposase